MKSGDGKVWDRCPKCGATVEIEVPDTRHPREKKRERRLSRRRWLARIAILVLLIFAGVNGWMVMRYSRELQAVDGLAEETEEQMNITTAPVGPMWLKRWLLRHKIPFPQTVVAVDGTESSSGGSETTDRFLEFASDLPGLLYLSIDEPESSEITDQGMTHLRNMRLTHLKIGSPQITDTGLYYLRDMTNLTDLEISGSPQLTDKGFAYLAGLVNMTRLQIEDVPHVTDAGLAAMRDMKRLEQLSISGPAGLTGEGLVHLEGLKNLTELELQDVPELTDAGLAHLAKMTNLGKLSISGAPHLSKEGIAALRNSLPNAAIEINGKRVAVEE